MLGDRTRSVFSRPSSAAGFSADPTVLCGFSAVAAVGAFALASASTGVTGAIVVNAHATVLNGRTSRTTRSPIVSSAMSISYRLCKFSQYLGLCPK